MELMEMVSKVVSTVKGDKNMLSEFSVECHGRRNPGQDQESVLIIEY